jgi:hypothetical protein
MNTQNKMLLWAVKITAAIFNMPSTGYVFYEIFKDTPRGIELVYFNTFLAVLLIDVLFLWVLNVLEDERLDPFKRLPVALSAILLSIVIVWVGYKDEGALAFAPRIGLLVLVFNDLIAWLTDFLVHYNSREAQEQRIRNNEVLHKRKVKQKARKKAVNSEEYTAWYVNKELEQISVESERSVEIPPIPVLEELPANIFKVGDGYGWVDYDDVEHTMTSLKKPYTLKGASLALTRYENKVHENGKSVQER